MIVEDVQRHGKAQGIQVLEYEFQTQFSMCESVLPNILIIPPPPLEEFLKVNSLIKMKCKRV